MKTEKQVRTWEISNKGGFLERDEQKVFGPNTEKIKVISHEDHLAIVAELEQRIKKLREALKFYGNEKNWSNLINVIYQGSYVTCSTINKDDHGEYDKHNVRRAGQKAREALKQDEVMGK